MAEETSSRPSLLTRMKGYLKEAPFFCKIIELVLCVIATGLVTGPFQQNQFRPTDIHHIAIFHVAVCGYIFINAVLIMSHLLGERLPKKTALIFSTMGAILCCTAGLILIRDWDNFSSNLIHAYLQEYSDQTVAAGSFAILAALVFAIDTYFTNKND
ncbi:hypothetical protein ALC53_12711 [Atta colombica]|uniref:MARVEL domain-containing protein n=1 Tax=Atta colombica TaxID=520822 RepID=A0A195AXQ2_9HYME|nr:PREDICTED: uncharacterized protein LOC108692413 [Atta colombica]KYM76822.1 hypothetical protein ALC53_12711 [Atta colombica]